MTSLKADTIRVMIETPKKRKLIASAFDWPGWDRRGKSEEDALQVLEGHRPRYRKVAELAALAREFDAAGALEVAERVDGSSTTPLQLFGATHRIAISSAMPDDR